MKRVDQFAEELDDDNPAKEEKTERRVRRLTYESMSKALRLAAKLDPSSRRSNGSSPRLRKSSAITPSATRDSPICSMTVSGSGDDEDAIFFCRKLRGRVAFLWVESQRDKRCPPGRRYLEHAQGGQA